MSNDNEAKPQIEVRVQPSESFSNARARMAEKESQVFEIVKHLTTLNAGSIVLIATFLQNIFPNDKAGDMAIGEGVKWLVGGSFVLFAVSLVASGLFMYVSTLGLTILPLRAQYEGKGISDHKEHASELLLEKMGLRFKSLARYAFILPYGTFVLGISFFGTAVLLNLF